MVPNPKPPVSTNHEESLLNSPSFKALVKHRWKISFVLSLLMMGSYFVFILGLALRKDLFATYSLMDIPVGIYFGVGLILLAWCLTGIYVYIANRTYDREVEKLVATWKGGN